MPKYTKEEYAAAKKQSNELLKLVLEKTGVSRKRIHELAENEFVVANLDVVTLAERKRFDKLVFSL